MKKKQFRVALVGCGTIALNHFMALGHVDGAKVIALCDIKPERCAAYIDQFGFEAKVYTDYIEMLDTEKPDAVHITTPHYLHAEMTVAALERGIDVFLEKPMCISTDEIARILEAEKKSTARVCVSFQNRFLTAVREALRIVEEDGGALGGNFCVFWERTEKYYTESGWRGSYATEGGGVMINQAIHSIDMLTLFLGKPVSVCATKSNHHLKGIIEVEDSCEGVIEFEGGKKANFYATTSAGVRDHTALTVMTKNHTVRIEPPELYIDGNHIPFEKEIAAVGKQCYGNGHYKIIPMFYDAIENGKEMPVTAESAQYAVRILLTAYKSNDEKTIIV